ncbi:MAG: TolC family protein [Planctomycetes bacterium]|nr:TolC family protein [Planctomycetota bacterium]
MQPVAGHPFLDAVDGSPLVLAARARLRAAQARIRAVGVLPDPVVSAEGRRMRDDGTKGLELWLEQDLPRWGERDAERGMARAEVLMAQAELADARGMAASEIAMALSRSRGARARAALQDEEVARMRVLVDQVTAMVAVGGDANATDVLSLRSRIAAAELMAADLRRMAIDADDEAGARIGGPAGQALPDMPLPDQTEVVLGAYAPGLMAQARVAEAEAREDMARSHGYPMVGVGVGWEREDLDMPDDGVMAMVAVSIPLYRDAHDAEVRAAQASQLAARRQVAAERLRAEVLLRRARRAQQQAEQAERVATDVATRVEAEIEVLRSQMAAGGGAMGGRDLLMRLFDRLDARSQASSTAIEARAEADGMTAELWRFLPLTATER